MLEIHNIYQEVGDDNPVFRYKSFKIWQSYRYLENIVKEERINGREN